MGCLLLKIFNKTRYRKIQLLKSLNCKVIIKVWEHTSWGNSIHIGKKESMDLCLMLDHKFHYIIMEDVIY